MFTNQLVALESLPEASGFHYSRVETRYVILSTLVAGLIALLISGVALIAGLIHFENLSEPTPGWLFFLPFSTLLIGGYRYFWCRRVGFGVREHDVVLHVGVVQFRETIQPLIRVQHVELTRGPLEKRLGLARLKLFSAGSAGATFSIPGLSLRNAAKLRRYVLTSKTSGG